MTEIQQILKTIQANRPRQEMQLQSERYYRQQNDAITQRRKTFATDNGRMDHPYLSNKKIKSGFVREIVDQKISYSINSSTVCTINGKDISEVVGSNWYSSILKVSKDSAKKGFGVVQFYLEGSTVKHKIIPPEQVIPCYNDDGVLVKVVRQYSKSSEKYNEINVVEIYTSESKSVFTQADGNEWVCELDKQPVLVSLSILNGKTTEVKPMSWGVPPFAILKNNEYFESDFVPLKPYIDEYDFVISDFANNTEDNQENLMILKNYDGQNIQQLLDMMKQKIIKVSDDGDATNLSTPIHTEAKSMLLGMLRSDIFEFAMAVDMKTITGTTTATEIESKYTNLNNKASEFEGNCTDFIEQFVSFYTGNQKDSDSLEIEVKYNRQGIESIKVDEKIKLATLSNQSIGSLSETTRLSINPFVVDVEEEIKLKAAEESEFDTIESMENEPETV
jgi:SPP1 family phage portal protein